MILEVPHSTTSDGSMSTLKVIFIRLGLTRALINRFRMLSTMFKPSSSKIEPKLIQNHSKPNSGLLYGTYRFLTFRYVIFDMGKRIKHLQLGGFNWKHGLLHLKLPPPPSNMKTWPVKTRQRQTFMCVWWRVFHLIPRCKASFFSIFAL